MVETENGLLAWHHAGLAKLRTGMSQTQCDAFRPQGVQKQVPIPENSAKQARWHWIGDLYYQWTDLGEWEYYLKLPVNMYYSLVGFVSQETDKTCNPLDLLLGCWCQLRKKKFNFSSVISYKETRSLSGKQDENYSILSVNYNIFRFLKL